MACGCGVDFYYPGDQFEAVGEHSKTLMFHER
jgi:hypothetical protein